jgi:predicted RNA-binding Zn-ribbon protein involved in translation (DUF1610 family)
LNDSVHCPNCGKAVSIGKMIEGLSSVDVKEQHVHFVVRRFRTACPNCGAFFHDRVGHHDTIGEKAMARLFPKGQRKRLRNALPIDERKLFDKVMVGKREPKDGEVERWLALQNANRDD